MITVYKYPFSIQDSIELELPRGAVILHFDCDPGSGRDRVLAIWATVNTEMEKETRYFRLVGTGHPLDHGKSLHVGSTLQYDSEVGATFVWHLFEVETI